MDILSSLLIKAKSQDYYKKTSTTAPKELLDSEY
jgi:hypothetical protein